MEISFKQTIFSLDSKNKKCNDCDDDDVKFVSINNGITLCELCAQIHKNFGNQISYIRSIEDEFDDYLMNFFIYGGNKKFRRTLRNMGVNLDVKKGNLYRTFGVDYYRRNLKSIVKGNSQLDKDFDNPNEVMKINSNAFPEFENYIIKGAPQENQTKMEQAKKVLGNIGSGLFSFGKKMYSGVKQGANYVAVKAQPATTQIKKGAVYMGHQVGGAYTNLKNKIVALNKPKVEEQQKEGENPENNNEGGNNEQEQPKEEEKNENVDGPGILINQPNLGNAPVNEFSSDQ